jgi:hypothetical protein
MGRFVAFVVLFYLFIYYFYFNFFSKIEGAGILKTFDFGKSFYIPILL